MIYNIKEYLLNTGIVIDNSYLDQYCELVSSNKDTPYETHRTQCHHIIPRYYFQHVDPNLENSASNKINLLYKDHILAHYYLALCSSNSKYIANNVAAVYKMSNAPQTIFEDGTPVEFFQSLDKYQEVYEVYAKHQGDHLRGKHQSAEHIRSRVVKNTGQKRSAETRKKMSAWQKGRPKSESAKMNMRIAQKRYAEMETEEHKRVRTEKCKQTKSMWTEEFRAEYSKKLSAALKGRIASASECAAKSKAMTGVAKSEKHKIALSRARSKYIYIT